MFNVGEDVFHGSRDDTRLFVVSRLWRGKINTLRRESDDRTHQCERLSRGSLPVGKHNGIVTLHSGDDMVPGDFVVNGLVLRSGYEFVEMEFRGSGA